jgi:hypothetical protein
MPASSATSVNFHGARGVLVRARGPVVSHQYRVPVESRDQEVRAPVVVEIGARDTLHEPDDVQAVLGRALREGAVAVVAEELAGVGVAPLRLVADEQVEPAVAVVVKPYRCSRRAKPEEPGLHRDIGEGAVAVVAHQRDGIMSLGGEPRAPQDKDVHQAVVVVVARDQVEAADLALEPCLLGALREGAVAVVAEHSQLLVDAPGGDHQVKEPVVVEILQHDAPREPADVEPHVGGDVREASDVMFRREESRVQQLPRGHLGGVLAKRHVGYVEQPARLEVRRIPLEQA